MKRLVPVLIVLIAATAFWFRDSFLPQPPGGLNHLGYVEGETVLIAAPSAGRIVSMPVSKGADVSAGDVLFSLDDATTVAELTRAEAAIATAEAAHANLLTGKRAPLIAVIRAQRAEAEAGLELAKKEKARAAMLASSGTAAQSRLDTAETQVRTFEARIAQFKASEQAAELAARPEDIAAAKSRIDEARATAKLARQKRDDLTLSSPVKAMVENLYFDAGEWVGAGQPVVSLLPPNAITLRFFVPEASLAAASPGTRVTFLCDGCGAARTAVITRVATTPEYTPPVIYSQGARAKLVFLVEAKPDRQDALLRPGLPIEVEPLP